MAGKSTPEVTDGSEREVVSEFVMDPVTMP